MRLCTSNHSSLGPILLCQLYFRLLDRQPTRHLHQGWQQGSWPDHACQRWQEVLLTCVAGVMV